MIQSHQIKSSKHNVKKTFFLISQKNITESTVFEINSMLLLTFPRMGLTKTEEKGRKGKKVT